MNSGNSAPKQVDVAKTTNRDEKIVRLGKAPSSFFFGDAFGDVVSL
jgi:hypothetical protein